MHNPTTDVLGVQPGETVTLRWTVENGGCMSYDELTVINDEQVNADAGPDIYQCDSGDFAMAANDPLVTGAGFWEIIGAPHGASIEDPTDPRTVIHGLNIDESASLKWTLTNGTCIDSDTIVILHSAPVLAHAGSNQEKCTIGSFTLAANDPVLGIGQWSFIGEKYDAIIDDNTAYNANVSGLLLNQMITLRWTVTNGGCEVYEDVVLTNNQAVDADAGLDQANCNNGDFTLSAVDPDEGFGIWSIVGAANNVVIDNITAHNSDIFGLDPGTSTTLRWYVTNGGCEDEDLVTITNHEDITAIAGDDQAKCNNGSFTLSATPPSIGTGNWSIIGADNGIVIDDPSLYNTSVSGLSTGKFSILRWTVTNGLCTHSDDIVLNNYQIVMAQAGNDQVQCDDGSFDLTAVEPTSGSGQWSIIGDALGAIITDINLYNTSVNGLLTGQSITLRWTVDNGSCSSY